MNIISISIICIISTLTILSIKRYNPEISMLITLGVGVFAGIYLLSFLTPIVKELNSILESANIKNAYSSALFKSLGICFLCQFASDSCNDAGEKGLASKIELCGKIAIMILSLPLLNDILKIALDLMN